MVCVTSCFCDDRLNCLLSLARRPKPALTTHDHSAGACAILRPANASVSSSAERSQHADDERQQCAASESKRMQTFYYNFRVRNVVAYLDGRRRCCAQIDERAPPKDDRAPPKDRRSANSGNRKARRRKRTAQSRNRAAQSRKSARCRRYQAAIGETALISLPKEKGVRLDRQKTLVFIVLDFFCKFFMLLFAI